jgi:hypothetical protein
VWPVRGECSRCGIGATRSSLVVIFFIHLIVDEKNSFVDGIVLFRRGQARLWQHRGDTPDDERVFFASQRIASRRNPTASLRTHLFPSCCSLRLVNAHVVTVATL